VAQLSHPPGDERRAELTWVADQSLGVSLDSITKQLEDVGTQVDSLSADAKDALIAVSSGDGDGLTEALDRGAARASAIDATVAQLRVTLGGLPGASPDDATVYATEVIARRAALDAAVAAVGTLSGQWSSVTARSTDAATLTSAIRTHDATLASAAAAGVKAQYAQAIGLCNKALTVMAEISSMRNEFVQPDQATVLDDWIARHLRLDNALLVLYQALKASGGVRNPTVDAAYREENAALAALPSDNREVVVIISQVAQAGLNDAVVAIEFARGQIDAAIQEAVPSPSPG